MNAAVVTGAGERFEVQEVELAGPGPGEVLVRIAATGLCASDLHVLDGARTLAPFPMVLGHEAPR
jgi:Zn-dependent alcohol dehydrogenase